MSLQLSLSQSREVARALCAFRDLRNRHLGEEDGSHSNLYAPAEVTQRIQERMYALIYKLEPALENLLQPPSSPDPDFYPQGVAWECESKFEEAAEALSSARCTCASLVMIEDRVFELCDAQGIQAYQIDEDSGHLFVLRDEWLCVVSAFWRNAVQACVNLCGTYDRIAQMLVYVFFNERMWDRRTLVEVLQRLDRNYAKSEPLFAAHAAWGELRKHQEPMERTYARRDALVHSASFTRAGNPIGPAVKEQWGRELKPTREVDEVAWLEEEARRVTEVFLAALDLCHFGLDTLRLNPPRYPPAMKAT